MMAAAIRVLYVDDEPALLDTGKLILEQSGDFTVTTALGAPDAIRLLEQRKFDAIVSDYQMPKVDGIQFLVLVRSRFGSIPFILFTGRGREEVVIQAINSGADFYLQKGGDADSQFAELAHKIKQSVSRKMAEELLREHDERISLLLNSTAEAIYGLDINGNCTFCNNSCLHLLGYKHPDELLGKNMHWKIHAKHADGTHFPIEECRIFQAIKKGEGTHGDDEVLWRSGGKSFPVEFWSYPQIHNGMVVGAVVTFLDITERKELENEVKFNEQKLKKFSSSLAAANRKLTLFAGITRHEILNQLTILTSYLSLLEIKERDPTLNKYCSNATTAAQKITNLIQFTKEYEGIEVNVPAWQGNWRTLVDNAVKETPLGQVIVKNDLPAGLEVFADPLITKVCYNLMNNAVLYGGKITTIRFSVKESGDEQVIVCEDDGDGVVAEDKERIFDRGYGKKNTGFGLFLSREILAITGITIIENGTPGKGARFEITMPKGIYRFTGTKTEYFASPSDDNDKPVPVPAPVVTGATTNAAGTVITIMFNKAMNNPAGKHAEFTYKIGSGSAQSFSSAALNADPTRIDLTTAGTPIAYGDKVTVSYTGTGITATDDGVLATFTDYAATNIRIHVIQNPSQRVLATFTDHAPAHNVTGDVPTSSLAALDADPTRIDLATAGTPIAYGDKVKVSDTGTSITATDDGVLESFASPSDDNDKPVPAPVVTGATTNAAGTVITIIFNKAMNNPAGKHAEFKYKIGSGSAQSFSAAALNAYPTRIDLTTAGTPIAYGDMVKVSYTGTGITATDGGVLAIFTDHAATNDVPGDVPKPSVAALNADPTKIDLTTAGTPIAYGDTVKVSYAGTDITATDDGVPAIFTDNAATNDVPGDVPKSSLSAHNADPTKITHGSLRTGQYQQIINGIIILFLIVNVMIIFSLVSERSQNSFLNPVNTTAGTSPMVSPTITTASTIIPPVKTITPTPAPTPTPVPAQKGYVNIFYMNNQKLETSLAPIYLNLVNPPLIIDYNVIPQNITDIKSYDYKILSTVHHDTLTITRPYENAEFTVTVINRDTGEVVVDDGYGKEYGLQTPRRLEVREIGNYTIQADGQYVNVTLSLEIPKMGNLPA